MSNLSKKQIKDLKLIVNPKNKNSFPIDSLDKPKLIFNGSCKLEFN